jgi:two-component system sensor histidine kinase BaeS
LRNDGDPERAVTFRGAFRDRELRVRCMRMSVPWPGSAEAEKHLTVIQDVSPEKEVERQREDWRSMAAHDLRAPLTNILGTLALLDNIEVGKPLSHAEKDLIAIGLRSTRRMLELLNDHLDVAKLDAGMMPVEPEAVDLGALLAECVQDQASTAAQKEIAVSASAAPGLRALADPILARRVVQNLLNNALKFTPEGGRVSLSAVADGRRVTIRVEDSGPGIAAEDLPRIFDRYYQARARRAGRIRGVGLGLTFCREAMKAMGGEIAVESSPGKGTSFSLRLPRP